jgi:hypothetical protein
MELHVHKRTVKRFLWTSVSAILNEGVKKVVVASMSDISDRVNAEKLLAERESSFRNMDYKNERSGDDTVL